MRLSFLLFALVACATAIPQLPQKAGDVDVLTKQRDVLLLLQQVSQEIIDTRLRKIGMNYDIRENIQNYHDQGVVKFFIRSFELRHIQRKGVPFTTSNTKLRKEVAVLTRVFLTAKDYDTFVKTAAWARCRINEIQFVKAFFTAVLRRKDTRNVVVLPALYEVFPYHYIDARVIRKAQKLRSVLLEKSTTKKTMDIPVDVSPWLTKGEDKLAYFTQDIGLAQHYSMFTLAGWTSPYGGKSMDEVNPKTFDCENCEISRGAQYYYLHQQLLARYHLERLSNNLMPTEPVDITHVRTPFKSHLAFLNGLEIPGRRFDYIPKNRNLINTVKLWERRLVDAIDQGFVMTTQGSILNLFDRKGLNLLGNLIEGTGRSINPRYYGSLQAAARQLLSGSVYERYFWEPIPGALEISDTATRDPIFYKLFKRIINLFIRYQNALPMYKRDDLMVDGVKIETVKFDKLVTYCDKFKVDIDAVTRIPLESDKERVQINAVVDRLNHKPFVYEIVVDSKKVIKDAVLRLYIGPKWDHEGRYINIEDNRHLFVEMDQFMRNINIGKNVILRKSDEAPMRSNDIITKKEILHKVEDALNSHEPFYIRNAGQMYAFPERLALPKGKRDGLVLQAVVIISEPKLKQMTYTPVVPEKDQTYQTLDFDNFVTYWKPTTWYKKTLDSRESSEEMYGSGERYGSGETHDIRKEKMHRYRRSEEDLYDTVRDIKMDRKTRLGMEHRVLEGQRGTGSSEERMVDITEHKDDYLRDYYKDKKPYQMIGGFVSLDGRPLGYPFNRPFTMESLWIPNIKVTDITVFYEGRECMT